jgi:hypothetical protein
MDVPNIFQILLSELVNDRFQLEEELERIMNLDISIPEKVKITKVALENVAINDLMMGKWNSYLPLTNNEELKEEDGKV